MIIAERVLKKRNASKDISVPIRIFAPTQEIDAWACHWEIHWPDRLRTGDALGFDGAQALIHAFQTVGSEIYASDEHKSGQLFWSNFRRGYGFPVPQNIRDVLIGDDADYF
ncbi:MAG: hypothetical protein NTZ72_20125 [Afipia sp.]|nr:hypothetical protein [Afipia sp.]